MSLIAIAVAVITGVFASLLAPIAQGMVSNFADKRKRRRDLVDSWRAGLAKVDSAQVREVSSTPWYETLRPYLSPDIREHFEYGYPPNSLVIETLAPPRSGDTAKVNLRPNRNLLAGRIDAKAKEWKVD